MVKKERGQGLILALILLAVGSMIIIPLLQLGSTVSKSRQLYGQYINEDYAADAAIEYGMWRLKYESGFAASLPVGVESEPFFVTLNGVDASTIIKSEAPSGQLSGQELGGRAGDEIFKVTKTVVATSVYQTLATDGFESASGSGGTGSWVGSWTLTGDYQFSTSGEQEGSYHLRLRGDDNQSPGDGRSQRTVNLSGSSGNGPFLYFWARVESFESGDTAQVKVSLNGTNWDILRTFNYQDSDNQYHLYQYDLTSYGTPSVFYLAFETNLSSSYDYFYIDAISFSNTIESSVIQPGVNTIYTYYVSIQNLDPEGGFLDRITDILPNRRASSGDYLQYIPGSTSWDWVAYDTYAFDGFESGTGSGGTGNWTGAWTLSGDYAFDTSGEFEGNYHLRLRGDDNQSPGDGRARRTVNLSSSTGVGPFLIFWARLDSFESSDSASVKVSVDGVNWDTLRTFVEGEDDDTYHPYTFDLSGYGRPTSFYLAFEANMSSDQDYFYVDGIEFNNYQQTATKWPVPPFDPTGISDTGSSSGRHEELIWDFEDAGYSDIQFAYGEIKTFSFRAQASLTEGVYCNEIRATVGAGGWATDIATGKTAKIIVGNPADTRCTGGLLAITKTADPLIIYPNELTTITYTINIENQDSVPIEIHEIEDWLPSTGSADQDDAFSYVDNSAYGYIIGRSSPPVLFYDPFNWSDTNTVPNWTDSDGSGINAAISSTYVRMRSSANITRSAISTANYNSIVVSYRWSGDSDAESSDLLVVQWKPTSSGTWNTLGQHALNTTNWNNAGWNLPASADNTQIDIRFLGNTNVSDEYARLDDFKVSSSVPITTTPVGMPDDNSGSDFFTENWESAPLYRRWRLNWDFSDYPAQDDPVWNDGGLLEGYEFADYNPYLELQPGESFVVVFQVTVTLVASGSYYNEVFVQIDNPYPGDDWLYSWPVAGVTVPQYDLQAQTLNSVLRAAAMLNPQGYWYRSWHWKKRR